MKTLAQQLFKYMRTIIICCAIVCIMPIANALAACPNTNQIDVNGDGTNCVDTKFTVTTTSDTTSLNFHISASGTFYVDCGDNGTLSGSDASTVSGSKITHNTTGTRAYTCIYTNAGTHIIRFGGVATGYFDYIGNDKTITFNAENTATHVYEIRGSLGALFPSIGDSHPHFIGTFEGCTGLTEIPGNLFSGITTADRAMFVYTFKGCTGLTSIPGNLFSGVTTAGAEAFAGTFAGCTGLTSIPGNLFSGITTAGDKAFDTTFYGCTGLTTIPPTLFSGITTAGNHTFDSTFRDCTGLTTIPGNLFSNIATAGLYTFRFTFNGCTGLTEIPGNLFSGITTAGDNAFVGTFRGCTGLTTITGNLFSNITTAGTDAFRFTFDGCTNLAHIGNVSYIPKSMFAGLVNNGLTDLMSNTFRNTALDTSCPIDMVQFATDTGYDNPKVMCETCPSCTAPENGSCNMTIQNNQCVINYTCNTGYTLNGTQCDACPAGTYYDNGSCDACTGQTYTNQTAMTSCTACTDGIVDSDHTSCTACTCDSQPTNGTCTANVENNQCVTNYSCNTGYTLDDNNQCVSTCNADEIEVNGQCFATKFTLTTTSDTTKLQFSLGATGTFYVDCGAEGTLSSGGKTITRTNSSSFEQYTCNYDSAGEHTIRFSGLANGYSTSHPSISFGWEVIDIPTREHVKSVAGSLGAIFPTLRDSNSNIIGQPHFLRTFSGCTSLTSIPSTLFSGVSGARPFMFSETFYGCTGLTSIPSTLFSGVSGAANGMFSNTFYKCTGLTEIPSTLFSGVSGAADSMFSGTFSGCAGLTSIPAGLFSNVRAVSESMFADTFSDCTGLTSVPETLFGNITGSAPYLFYRTFSNCAELKTIPSGLFNRINTSAPHMFHDTFADCTALTTIPNGLFANIRDGAQGMFQGTFLRCTGITTIPANLFANITTPMVFGNTFQQCDNLAYVSTPSEIITYVPKSMFAGLLNNENTDFMMRTFINTQLDTICPEGDSRLATDTGYTEPKVICGGCPAGTRYNNDQTKCIDMDNVYDIEYVLGQYGSFDVNASHPTVVEYNQDFVVDAPVHPNATFTGWSISNMAPSMLHYYDSKTTTKASIATTKAKTFKNLRQSTVGLYDKIIFTANWACDAGYSGAQCTPNSSGKITLDSALYKGNSSSSFSPADIVANPNYVFSEYGSAVYSDITHDNVLTRLTTLPVKNGYTFEGFYTTKATGGQQVVSANGDFLYQATTQVTAKNGTATWYARWKPIEFYATYDCNGGTGITPRSALVVYNQPFTTPENTCIKSGFVFTGWKIAGTDVVLAENYTSNSWTYTVSGNVELVAQWSENAFVVTLNKNDDSAIAGTPMVTADYGARLPTGITLPKRPGYLFGGYYDASGVEYYDASGTPLRKWPLMESGTLYAKWDACGTGYYCDTTGHRYKCTAGTTTIGFGAGADEIADCGHVLHIGESSLYLRKNKKTEHSLDVRYDDGIYYGNATKKPVNMSHDTDGKLQIKFNEETYYIYDDSANL